MKNKHDLEPHNRKKTIATLKYSLSKTLTHFFLLAGRITNDNTSICCSDEGAVFVEANVNCSMFEILKEPDSEVLAKLLPCSVLCTEPVEEYSQIVAEANVFNCGGIAISLCLLHKLMDATSMSCFLTFWASINRGSSFDSSFTNSIVCSNYKVVSSIFPQTNSFPFDHSSVQQPFTKCEQKRHFQRFVFKSKAISDLKAKSKSKDVPNPTSVEVLSGFVWKCISEAASAERPSVLTHAVNLRTRMEPSLPEAFVGNIFWIVVAHYSSKEEKRVEVSELVSLLRQFFAEINGDGVEVWILLDEEEMKLLVQNPEFL